MATKHTLDALLSSSFLQVAEKARSSALVAMCMPWLLGCKIREDESMPTAATDGVAMFINPKWFDTLTTAGRVFVVCHEAMHGILRHIPQMDKFGPSDPEENKVWRISQSQHRANIAMDIWINTALAEALGGRPSELCVGGLTPIIWLDSKMPNNKPYLPAAIQKQFSLDNHDWYWVYQHLAKEAGKGGNGSGIGEGSDVRPGDAGKQAEAEMAAGRAIASAAASAKFNNYGSIPGWIERLMDKIGQPRRDWKRELQDAHNGSVPAEYGFKRFKRPYFFDKIGIPTMSIPGLGPIACFIDTSGSITADMLREIGSELHGIWKDARPDEIHIAYVDAQVAGEQVIGPDDTFELTPAGGGGTDFRPAFQWVEDKGLEIELAVYITDGYGCHATEPPSYPVIWVVLQGGAADDTFPFGKVIRLGD